MADEAYEVQVDKVLSFPVAENANIAKGATLKVTGTNPNQTLVTRDASTVTGTFFIALNGKKSTDGRTVVGVLASGIVDVATTAAVAMGDQMVPATTANKFRKTTSSDAASTVMGYCVKPTSAAGRCHMRLINR